MTEKLYDKLKVHQNKYIHPESQVKPKDLSASFVIPVYNSAESIAATVNSIDQQQGKGRINEVILVNDGSTDNTEEVIRDIAKSSGLKIVVVKNKERSYAAYSRNRGLEQATGDLVCFIDSDIVLPANYLLEHMQFHAVNECITFSLRGNVSDSSEAKFPIDSAKGDFREELINRYGDLQDAPYEFSESHSLPEMCLTCAVTYKRSDLIKVKGCPENFVGWGFNDTAMAAKVISLGRAVIPVQDASVCHIEHAPRSGRTSKKWAEFAKNKERYQKMLQLPVDMTFNYQVEALDY